MKSRTDLFEAMVREDDDLKRAELRGEYVATLRIDVERSRQEWLKRRARGRVRKLPWTYWPIMAFALIANMAVAGVVGVAIGINTYIAAGLAGGAMVLYEVWTIARDQSSERGSNAAPSPGALAASERTKQGDSDTRKEPDRG